MREYYNPYSYVRNNPIYYVDPDGKHPLVWLALGLGIGWLSDGISYALTGKGIGEHIGDGLTSYANDWSDANDYGGDGDMDYYPPNAPCIDCR